MCIVLCPNIVQTFSSRSVVTPRHRCVIMYKVVDVSLPKLCHDQQNVLSITTGYCYFVDFGHGISVLVNIFFCGTIRYWAPPPPPFLSPMFPIYKCLSARLPDVVLTGENDTKTISVDADLFDNGAKQLRFRLKKD